MRCRRLKPGSLTAVGAVVDWLGILHLKGPIWIPADWGMGEAGNDRRAKLMTAAGRRDKL